MKELQKNIDKIDARRNGNDNRREIIKEYTDMNHLDRETVQKLIDHICVGKRLTGSREVPIEIHWNF